MLCTSVYHAIMGNLSSSQSSLPGMLKSPRHHANVKKQSVKWQKLLQVSNNITKTSKTSYLPNILRELKKKKAQTKSEVAIGPFNSQPGAPELGDLTVATNQAFLLQLFIIQFLHMDFFFSLLFLEGVPIFLNPTGGSI